MDDTSQSKSTMDRLMAEQGSLLVRLIREWYYHDDTADLAFNDICREYGLDPYQIEDMWLRCYERWKQGFLIE